MFHGDLSICLEYSCHMKRSAWHIPGISLYSHEICHEYSCNMFVPSGMLGQPGSSRQTEQFDNDVDKRLKEFVEDFVSIYEGYFSEYHKRLREQIPKSGKWADLINGVIEIGKSGTEGIEAAEIKAISVVAVSISRPFDSG